MTEKPNIQKPKFIHKGAIVLLLTPLLSWGGVNLVKVIERVARLEAKELSHKELIIRVDRNVDRLDTKIDQIILKLK